MYIKLQAFSQAIESAEKAINLNNENPKAYYRLAQAQMNDTKYDKALENAKRGLQLKKNDKMFMKLVKQIKKKQKQANKTEQKFYKNMFS